MRNHCRSNRETNAPEASYVYGQMLVVDGGMTIGGFAFE
jgi:hypothetical protein